MAKILVVDDSVTMRQQLQIILTRAGHQVIEAENGHEGIKKVSHHRDFAIILTDLNMPIMNGMEFAEKINADPFFSHIPIVMLTTVKAKEKIDEGRQTGIKVWVVKPWDPEKLLAAIDKVLAMTKPS